MTLMNDIKSWLASDASDTQRAEVEQALHPPCGLLAAVNSVKLSGSQLRAAIGEIQHIQIRSEADVVQHGVILSAFADDQGLTPGDYAGPALHARAIALDRWCSRHDPYGLTDVDACFAAGATAPLIETSTGMAFEPDSFAELIAFIAELPF